VPHQSLVDINSERLKLAARLGASFTIDLSKKGENGEPVNIVHEIARNGLGPIDQVIECSGAADGLRTSIEACKNGGKVVVVGLGPPEMSLPLTSAFLREVDIIGIFRYCNTWPTAIALIASGKVDVKPLITQHYPLSEVEHAFHVAKEGKDEHGNPAVKVIITINDPK